MFQLNKKKFLLAFENWQLERKDRSTYQTFPLPEWNTDLGFWANALEVVKEVQKVGSKLDEIEIKSTSDSLSTTSIQEKKWIIWEWTNLLSWTLVLIIFVVEILIGAKSYPFNDSIAE